MVHFSHSQSGVFTLNASLFDSGASRKIKQDWYSRNAPVPQAADTFILWGLCVVSGRHSLHWTPVLLAFPQPLGPNCPVKLVRHLWLWGGRYCGEQPGHSPCVLMETMRLWCQVHMWTPGRVEGPTCRADSEMGNLLSL